MPSYKCYYKLLIRLKGSTCFLILQKLAKKRQECVKFFLLVIADIVQACSNTIRCDITSLCVQSLSTHS